MGSKTFMCLLIPNFKQKKNQKKSNNLFLRCVIDRQTDGRTDGRTDGQTDVPAGLNSHYPSDMHFFPYQVEILYYGLECKLLF